MHHSTTKNNDDNDEEIAFICQETRLYLCVVSVCI